MLSRHLIAAMSVLAGCESTGATPLDAVEGPDGARIQQDEDAATASSDAIEELIRDMTEPASADARGNNEAAVIFSGNYQQAVKLSPGYAPSFDNITSWCWVFATAEHTASNTAVEVRFSDVHALRRSTDQWEVIDSGRPSGYRGNSSGSTGELADEIVVDEETVMVRPGAPPRTDLVSYELWTPNAARQIEFVPDIKAVHASCQMRVVTFDPGQPSDLEDARYAGQMGFDFWRRAAGPFEPGVTQFWGPQGRMKPVTTEWQTFHVVGVKPYDPAWSNLPGELGYGEPYEVPNPYLDPPDTLALDELRENPPPLR